MLSVLLFLAAVSSADRELARDILKTLIELDTTHGTGNTTIPSETMAERLRKAGFPAEDIKVVGPPARGNLVVRYRGTDSALKPILLLAHLDVVEARREDWSVVFRLLERDGYFYGRGTGDDKGMAAIWIANLIRYKKEGYRPKRDLIVALTADEESGGQHNGVEWLIQNRRDLIDAEFCLNEGGNLEMKNGKRVLNQIQLAEKTTLNLVLEVRNAGGHSSMPVRDNAIYRLARVLQRLEEYEFPPQLNEVSRAFFERRSALESGQVQLDMKAVTRIPPDPAAVRRLSQSPFYNAIMRNTCVATRLEGGHADNALPQLARGIVNCRMLPGVKAEEVIAALEKVLADKQITITKRGEPKYSTPSPLNASLLSAAERVTSAMWPGVPVVPMQAPFGTDARDLRMAGIPTYGISGLLQDIDDVRWHGRDERIGVEAFFESQGFLFQLVKELAGK